MSIDVLQEKIRKTKNPSMVDLSLNISDLPPHLLAEEGCAAKAYGRFCREVLEKLTGFVPAVRLGFAAFAVLGAEGIEVMSDVLPEASRRGYYVALEAPYVLSPMMASGVADSAFGENAVYPCDGLIISSYPGSDVIKPFLSYVKDGKKDLFPVVRTSNKSGSELQDLLTGSRLVHAAAADLINRFGADNIGKNGYARVGAVAGAIPPRACSICAASIPGCSCWWMMWIILPATPKSAQTHSISSAMAPWCAPGLPLLPHGRKRNPTERIIWIMRWLLRNG